ncbi:hypothetical protein Hanom_Chr11g01004341 [Helianthus anomalus]
MWYCMYLYIDMKVEHFILVLAQSELMSDHEHDDSDTEFIDIDIVGSYGWVLYLSLHRHEGGKFTGIVLYLSLQANLTNHIKSCHFWFSIQVFDLALGF